MTSSVTKTCFDAIRAKQSALAAGYAPLVVENQSVYEQLLLRAVDSSSSIEEKEKSDKAFNQKEITRTRRQTPLVNAGYASRVLSISYAIQSFVSYHKLVSTSTPGRGKSMETRGRIRIVLLGCGVDVIGIWSRSLLKEDDNTLGLTVIEVDKPEVCSIKRKMITNQGMIKNLAQHCAQDSSGSTRSAANYYTGTIVNPLANENGDSSPDNRDSGGYDYVLIPGDLNDTSSLESIITLDDNNGLKDVPTLVVSELVISYLPPSSTNRLLGWCADRLCRTSDSALISLEPLGSPGISTDPSTTSKQNHGSKGALSVVKGYQQDYCKKFRDKMERGRSGNSVQNNTALQPSSALFHPIGVSTNAISSRLKKAGFADACTANLGVISSIAAAFASNAKCNENDGSKTLVCPDMFDEHAALIMHLQSYVLACGFVAPKTGHCVDLLFRRLLCSWEFRPNTSPDVALVRSGLPRMDFGGRIVYSEIEVSDEASARSLFQKTYGKDYTDKYPAIRKMVKGVLNNDMRQTAITPKTAQSDGVVGNSQGPLNGSTENASAIGNFYRSSGGIFLVATKYITQPFPKDEIIDENSCDQIYQSNNRQVVGCVGIRSSKGKEADPSMTLEIFRLAVDVNHRGRGIGKNLLRSVEAYAHQRRKKQRHVDLKFVANTLTILEEAANLYENCGYRAERETPLGNKLVLRAYAKEVASG